MWPLLITGHIWRPERKPKIRVSSRVCPSEPGGPKSVTVDCMSSGLRAQCLLCSSHGRCRWSRTLQAPGRFRPTPGSVSQKFCSLNFRQVVLIFPLAGHIKGNSTLGHLGQDWIFHDFLLTRTGQWIHHERALENSLLFLLLPSIQDLDDALVVGLVNWKYVRLETPNLPVINDEFGWRIWVFKRSERAVTSLRVLYFAQLLPVWILFQITAKTNCVSSRLAAAVK